MKGSISKVKRKNGEIVWRIKIYMGKSENKKIYQNYLVHGSKKEADAKLADLLHGLNTGGYIEPSRMTLSQFLDSWLNDYAKHSVEPSTYKWYKMIVDRHLKPQLGHILLQRLTPLDLQSYYARTLEGGRLNKKTLQRIGQPLSPGMVKGHHRAIHAALEQAVKWGLVARNVADAVTPPKGQRKQPQTLTLEQVQTFFEAAKESRNYVLYYLALFTGMRLGEVCGLRWSDLDLENKAIHVRQALKKPGPNPVFGKVKTKSSVRLVSISNEVINLLKHHKVVQAKEKLAWGKDYEDYGLVFAIQNGHPINPMNLEKREFKQILKKAELPDMRFHDLRHTCATLLLEAGVPAKVVSAQLGHSSISVTSDLYSHVTPGIQQQAATAMGNILNKAK